MYRPRWVFTLTSRLGLGLVIPMFVLALLVKGIARVLPSWSMVYSYSGRLTIYDIGRGIELGLAGDYGLPVGATITPVTSPDHQWIAAVNGDAGVYVFDLVKRTQMLLPLEFSLPMWSPDSRYVVTIPLQGEKDMNIQSNAEWMTIQLADIHSGDVRQIVPPYQYLRIWPIGWSSDNEQITFVAMTSPTPDYTFYTVNIDGSDFHELDCAISNSGTEQLTNFNFAPGAKKVIFSVPAGKQHHLYMLNFDDCSRTQLTDGDGYDDAAVWSPDGTSIAFLSLRDGQLDIYVMDADGQHVSRLTDTPEYEMQLSWSPDSQRLLFTSYATSRSATTYHYADLRDNSLHPFDLHHGQIQSYPAWGP